MASRSRVTILVKAYPQPSRKHSETVCCAGLDSSGKWRRLYPVRFRQLSDDQVFRRCNIVDFTYSTPTNDSRRESCRVYEDSITVTSYVSNKQKRENLVNPAIVASENEAESRGDSLALIRPTSVEFNWRRRDKSEILEARAAFEKQARQSSMFDKELDIIEPCPFEFRMKFRDEDGNIRNKRCSDWETSAAFFNLSLKYDEETALKHLQQTYCEQYFKIGLVFALGNMVSRPRTWQLLGIFPTARSNQTLLKI